MEYLYWLSQIEWVEQELVGNRLYILSQLLRHENPVLPGFVLGNNLLSQFLLNSDDFKSLIAELSALSPKLDLDNYKLLQSTANRSRQIVERSLFPESWQVRIGEAARQLETDGLILQPFLTLPYGENSSTCGLWRSHTCNQNPAAIAIAIKQVWSELFTAKSLVYRYKLGISEDKVNLAILVRPLYPACASGLVSITPNLIVIRATWGLEQSLLWGDVEGDKYYLDRRTGYVLSRTLGHKNYGYRVKQNLNSSIPVVDCLEAYLPQEINTKNYVLDSQAIARLYSLIKEILQQQPQIKSLVWTASESFEFWITEVSNYLSTLVDFDRSSVAPVILSASESKPIARGISAAGGRAIGSAMVVKNLDTLPELIPDGAILVTKTITPQHIALIKKFQGIITEVGGKTSHGAIVARELNIPGVVNVEGATDILQNGMRIFLHGDEGKIYPASAVQEFPLLNLSPDYSYSPSNQLIATKLMANISQPASIADCLNLPVDGVGLLRSELMLGDILAGTSPLQWQSEPLQGELLSRLKESLRQFVRAFAPRPVFYRSLDWTLPEIPHPIMGSRGTYSYQSDTSLFSLELEALAAIANEGYGNLKLILPFVRSVAEFKFCYDRIEAIGLTNQESFQVWIMAEVPSVIWLLPEYVRAGVKGIAIGSNDLTQLILGVDREEAQFTNQGLNANHPAVHQAIAQLIQTAKDHNIDCSICGQAPVDYPELIEKLINWGITTISVEPEALTTTHQAIARAERKILLDSLR